MRTVELGQIPGRGCLSSRRKNNIYLRLSKLTIFILIINSIYTLSKAKLIKFEREEKKITLKIAILTNVIITLYWCH